MSQLREKGIGLLAVLVAGAGLACGESRVERCLRADGGGGDARVRVDSAGGGLVATTLNPTERDESAVRSYPYPADTLIGTVFECPGTRPCRPERPELMVVHVGTYRLMFAADTALFQVGDGSVLRVARSEYRSGIGESNDDEPKVHEVWTGRLSREDLTRLACGDGVRYRVGNLSGRVGEPEAGRLRDLLRWGVGEGRAASAANEAR